MAGENLTFNNQQQKRAWDRVLTSLETLGFQGGLLVRNVQVNDWFHPQSVTRTIPAAAFARTPTTYDTACFAVVLSDGTNGRDLVNEARSLGAPVAFEVTDHSVRQWVVGHTRERTRLWSEYSFDQLPDVFRRHKVEWSPAAMLRAKSILGPKSGRQIDFVDLGLLPALESEIRQKLDRVMKSILNESRTSYVAEHGSEPDIAKHFRLMFQFMAAKILQDRNVKGFRSLDFGDPRSVMSKVGEYYQQQSPVLRDLSTQRLIARRMAETVSFENLSIGTLAYIYENTLVSEEVRRELGTHSTPFNVARYLVSRLIDESNAEGIRILEPCSGHGVLLIAALERLRELLPFDMDPAQRHRLFLRSVRGFELDPFALEISKLCLMLADFPYPNGWRIEPGDVFASSSFEDAITEANLVLCNPPYESFSESDRLKYPSLQSFHKPVELLHRILDRLPPNASLGFVLPRQCIDGVGYREVRERLARRFEHLEVVALPDRVFAVSRLETAMLIAKSPQQDIGHATVSFSEVKNVDLSRFLSDFTMTRREVVTKSSAECAVSLRVPPLAEVWKRLASFPTLGDIAKIHRGVEWQPPFDATRYLSDKPREGFRLGVSEVTPEFMAYEPPRSKQYLSTKKDDRRRNAFDLPWTQPKVIANAATVSGGHWRLGAFADQSQRIYSQCFFGIWPKGDMATIAIAAVINGPVANALLAVTENKIHNRKLTLARVPFPHLSSADIAEIESLSSAYTTSVNQTCPGGLFGRRGEESPEITSRRILLRIDAIVLKGYQLPPRLERAVLDFFRGHQRRVPFDFTEYYPESFKPYIPLWMYATEDFTRCTSSRLLASLPKATDTVLVDALAEVE